MPRHPHSPLQRLTTQLVWTETDCWEFQGLLLKGYGRIGAHSRAYYAHRLAFELYVGPIPEGLSLDHLCRNPACCNPRHLEPVTTKENMLRGASVAAVAVRTGFCHAGHDLAVHAYLRRDRQGRICRECKRMRDRARYRSRKAVQP